VVTEVDDRPVCLLTGASGTLGEAFCRRYSEQFRIVGVHRSRDLSVDNQDSWTVDPLAPAGRHTGADRPAEGVFAVRADLAEPEAIDRVVELALARFGRIDSVVNAAGMALWGPVLTSPQVVDMAAEQLMLNTLVPLRLVRGVAQRFWRNRAGENRAGNRCVVNVSSAAGLWVYPGRGQSVYSASKSALNTMSMHLADELSPIGIRVNVLAPESFPDPVPALAVVEALADLITGDDTGQIVLVDQAGARPV